jgi:U6 snRNA-associated Sm-like protein LSm1
MENLTLEEGPPQGAPGGAQMPPLGPGIPPPPNQQLPPQMFTTAAQLLDMTDSKDFFVVASRFCSRVSPQPLHQ